MSTNWSENNLKHSASGIRWFLEKVLSLDPKDDSIQKTPERVAKAWQELTAGYLENPEDILTTTFEADYDEMVIVSNIPFWTVCEHHMLPFHGVCTIGYIPKRRVIGLSKLPRLVQCYARRLQIQERLTRQIADAIDVNLEAEGVGVLITAEHTCMQMRGIKIAGSPTTTSAMIGCLRSEPETRAEFLRLSQHNG